MGTKRPTRTAGFSLIEMMIVITLLGAVVGSVLAVMRTTTRAQSVGSTAARLEAQAGQVLDQIAVRLRSSGLGTMTPALSAPFTSSQIDFQTTTGVVAGATVWGPTERIAWQMRPGEVDDGVDNNGNGLVDEGRIVWTQDVLGANPVSTVLANGVAEYLEGETAIFGDDNGNGLNDERGLCFDFDGTSVIIRLTLQVRDASGVVLTRTVQERVFFRNR